MRSLRQLSRGFKEREAEAETMGYNQQESQLSESWPGGEESRATLGYATPRRWDWQTKLVSLGAPVT